MAHRYSRQAARGDPGRRAAAADSERGGDPEDAHRVPGTCVPCAQLAAPFSLMGGWWCAAHARGSGSCRYGDPARRHDGRN